MISEFKACKNRKLRISLFQKIVELRNEVDKLKTK